jgi:hypothetical protein
MSTDPISEFRRQLTQKNRPPPVVFKVEHQLSGFNGSRPVGPGEFGVWESVGFHSFDEGLPFFERLESLDWLIDRAGGHPSYVDRVFGIFRPKETTVYLNQMFDYGVTVRAKRLAQPGAVLPQDDIVGFEKVIFSGVNIPKDAGVLVLLSQGWRKAFFSDFRPLLPPPWRQFIDYDIEIVAGQLLSHLVYTKYFLLSQEDWDKIITAGWFPFIFLVGRLWDGLIDAIRHGGDLKREEDRIHDAFSKELDEKLQSWCKKRSLSEDAEILRRAVESYKRADWISTVSLAMPRLEGILNRALNWPGSVRKLIDALTTHIQGSTHRRSLLFPDRLRRYLEETLFQYVDFRHDSSTVNRHSVAHGVASPGSMTRETALKLLLLVDHLFYCIPG